MKFIFLAFLTFPSVYALGQTFVGGTNSGAVSQNTLVYTVGEIYVVPDNPNEFGSGITGIASHNIVLTSGLQHVLSTDDLRIYPNPTANVLYFTLGNHSIQEVYIYDQAGKQVYSQKFTGNEISVAQLPTGTYFLRTNIETIQTFTFIKQ